MTAEVSSLERKGWDESVWSSIAPASDLHAGYFDYATDGCELDLRPASELEGGVS